MSIKLFRRKNKICIIIGVCLVLYFYLFQNNFSNERKESLDEFYGIYDLNVAKIEPEIVTKKKYVPPLPCQDCPGENGEGVSLTVSFFCMLI